MLVAHACIKVAGILQGNYIPNHYGYAVSDVFNVVYESVLGVAFQIGEQCLAPAYLPVFTSAREKENEARAWRYTSILFNLQFVILLMIGVLFHFYSDQIVSWSTQWDASNPAMLERRDMARLMIPYVAPGLIFMSLASLSYVVLNGYKEFFFAAFGDTMLKFCIVGGALAGGILGKTDWRYVAGGLVCGGALKFCTHLYAIGFKRLRMYKLSFDFMDPYVRAFAWLVVPLLAGILISKGRDIVFTNVLTSKEKLPTLFKNGRDLVNSIGFLVPYTLSIAMLPFFCDLSLRDDRKQLGEVLTKIVRMLTWFFVPVSIVIAVAAAPLCAFLYKGKTVTVLELSFTVVAAQLFCIQLPFQAIEMMVMQALFSSRRMIAPTLAGFFFSIVAAAIAYVGVKQGYVTEALPILVLVALAAVLSKVLKAIVLIVMLKSTVPVLPWRETSTYCLRVLVAGSAAVCAAFGAAWLYAGPLAFMGKILRIERFNNLADAAFIAIGGGSAYLAVSMLLRMEEPSLCWQWSKEKLRKRGDKQFKTSSV